MYNTLYHPCEGYKLLYPERGWYNEFISCFEPNCACAPDVARCIVVAMCYGWLTCCSSCIKTNHEKREVLESKEENICYKTGVYYCA